MITKWYPNSEDPQLGVFIQKHARAIALENSVSVLYAYGLPNQKEKFNLTFAQNSNVAEYLCYYKKNTGVFSFVINGMRYFRSILIAYKKAKHDKATFDLVHAYILLRTALIGKYLSLINKIPLVISEQWSGYATGKYNLRSAFNKWLTRYFCKSSAGLSMVSYFLQSKMHEHGLINSNETVTSNVISKTFSSSKNESEKINVLLVADLVDEIKNISSVIKAAAKARDEGHRFVIRIVGQGPDQSNLLKLAETLNVVNSTVIFEGLKTNEEVYEYLRQCDFLIMNSRFETFSLICVEAMSCSKPVLATKCGGPEEFINDSNGILIPVDDDIELFNQFLFMLKNFKRFNQEAIRKSVEARFSEKLVAKTFTDWYRKAVGA
jgi:glycosyltransferase involved in cell wall biosynthesis